MGWNKISTLQEMHHLKSGKFSLSIQRTISKYKSYPESRWHNSQKVDSLGGHDKPPIHGNCAIYFPGHVNDKEAVHFLLLKRPGAFGYVLLKHHFEKKKKRVEQSIVFRVTSLATPPPHPIVETFMAKPERKYTT